MVLYVKWTADKTEIKFQGGLIKQFTFRLAKPVYSTEM